RLTVNENDLLSNMPDDCLMAIFPFMDQSDLNEVSIDSQKMYFFSAMNRSKARKDKAVSLVINQGMYGGEQCILAITEKDAFVGKY
ncbi:hypothetical protein PMAYCL1PPCAC_22203, partial [Pristionchus mayeri]